MDFHLTQEKLIVFYQRRDLNLFYQKNLFIIYNLY